MIETYASWYTELTQCNRVVRKTAILGRLAKKLPTLYATQRLFVVSVFLIASMRTACPTNRILRDAVIPTVRGEETKLQNSSLFAFLQCHSLHHRSVCSRHYHVIKNPQSFPPQVLDTKFHTHANQLLRLQLYIFMLHL
jgi:hypothetical protein